ncbi:MAG: ribulose-phosphate 3-epimerase, partial [Chloroflexi bacterium]|nr:ribulose-phosphate 3-epimerase [Chloroflexota bacterium]
HYEAAPHLHPALEKIKSLGMKAGVAIKPLTPGANLVEVLDLADLVLVMTVEPGYGGQEFISGMETKVSRMRQLIEERGSKCLLEVDGGIDPNTAPLVVAAGADVLVAGTSIFEAQGGIAAGIHGLRESIGQVQPAS